MSTPTTYDIAALSALRDRVREATGPDWKLDERLFAKLHGWDYPLFGAAIHERDRLKREGINLDYTASLDACAALQAEVLHGCEMERRMDRAVLISKERNWIYARQTPLATFPLTWLCAILSALIAMHREAVNV